MDKVYFSYKILRSYLRVIFFKILYGKRFEIDLKRKIYLGEGTNIEIGKNGKLILKGDFTCRNYNNLKVTSGTLEIGNEVFLNNGNSINCRSYIEIGNNTIFGEGIKIYDHDHIIENGLVKKNEFKILKVIIGENVWLCSNVIVLRGSNIKNNSVIPSGTIIKREKEKK